MHEANGHGANIGCISYKQGHLIAVVVSVLYLRSVRFGRIEFVEGSRRSRVDGSGTSRRRSRVVVEVVVHVRFSERYLTNPTSSGRR